MKFRWNESSSTIVLSQVSSSYVKTVLETIFKFAADLDFKQEIPKMDPKLNYSRNHGSEAFVWHYLLHYGYLTYEEKDGRCFVSIPNHQVSCHWKEEMKGQMKKVLLEERFQRFIA